MSQSLLIVGCILHIALAARLLTSGLWRSYQWLTWLSVVSALRLGITPFLKPGTNRYFWWWAATEVCLWLVFVILTLDLQSQIFRRFPGLATFSRRFLKITLSVAIPLSLLSIYPALNSERAGGPIIILSLLAVQRAIFTSLIIFLVALIGALLLYRIELQRNTVIHAFVFFLYFLAKAGIIFLVESMGYQMHAFASAALMVASETCVLIWLLSLRRSGEQVPVRVGRAWDPEQSEQLVRRIGALNASVHRARQR